MDLIDLGSVFQEFTLSYEKRTEFLFVLTRVKQVRSSNPIRRINLCPFISLGAQPLSFRQVKKLLSLRYPSVSWMIPEFVYVPRWLLAVASHKF